MKQTFWNTNSGGKTYGEIQKISKDKNDPLQQKAKHMKKLIEQSRGRLKEKKDQEGRY